MSEDEVNPEAARPRPQVEVRVIGDTSRSWEEDEVVRLERDRTVPEPARAMGELEPAPSEARKWWKLGLRGVSGTMLGTVALLTVVVVTVVLLTRGGDSRAPVPEERGIEEVPALPADVAMQGELTERLNEATGQAEAWLAEYLGAGSLAEAAPLIRRGEALRDRLRGRWAPLRLDLDRFRGFAAKVNSTEQVGWYEFSGRDLDDEPVELVFVPGEKGLEFDWEASVGAGDVPFGELRKLDAGAAVAMRVSITHGNLHTSDFPEKRYECFRLADRLDRQVAWGYVVRGTRQQLEMARLFNTDSMIRMGRSEVRARVVLRSMGQAATGQFEIAEIGGMGWVEP